MNLTLFTVRSVVATPLAVLLDVAFVSFDFLSGFFMLLMVLVKVGAAGLFMLFVEVCLLRTVTVVGAGEALLLAGEGDVPVSEELNSSLGILESATGLDKDGNVAGFSTPSTPS